MVTAHHVEHEDTPYEHSHDDHTMNPHYMDPVSHSDSHHYPAYTETHDTHHHEAPRYEHESTYHVSHPELDHKFDDQRDVEPVHYHEHGVHGSFAEQDSHSYGNHHGHHESYANSGHVAPEITPYEHMVDLVHQDHFHDNVDAYYGSAHRTHRELDHSYDDMHDSEPVHYHEHSVHRSFPAEHRHSYHGDYFLQ